MEYLLKENIVNFFNEMYKLGIFTYTQKASIDKLTQDGLKELAFIEENLENIKKKTNDLQKSAEEIKTGIQKILSRLPGMVEEIKRSYTYFITTVQNLREVEQTGMRLISTIEEISTIARNAEIKAFHLGEKGKGLEVVAQELSKLANRIKRTTEDAKKPLTFLKNVFEGAEDFSSRFLHQVDVLLPKEKELVDVFRAFEEVSKEIMDLSENLYNAFNQSKKFSASLNTVFTHMGEIGIKSFGYGERASLLLTFLQGLEECIIENIEIEKKVNDNYITNELQERQKILLGDFKNLLTEVSFKYKDFERNLGVWKEESAKVRSYIQLMQKEKTKLNEIFSKVDEILRGSLSESIQMLGKELASLLFSLKEISISSPEWTGTFRKNKEQFESLEKHLKKLKEEIKDGEILTLYASVETARAGNPNDPISLQLKELVENSRKITEASIYYISKMKRDVLFEKKVMFDDSEKIYGFEELLKEIEKHIYFQEQESEVLYSLLGEMQKSIEAHMLWREKVSRIFLSLSSEWENLESKREKAWNELETLLREIGEITEYTKKEEVGKEKREYVYRAELSSDPVTLNPFIATDATSNEVIENIHKGLVQFSPKSTKLLPAVADSFNISEDGKTWTFKIRKGVFFHNGKEVLASDVIASLKRALKGQSRQYFQFIKGAKDYIAGKTSEPEGIREIKDNRVEIELEYPYAPFISNLALSSASIVCEENGRIIGCGPFVLKEWEKGKKIILCAFDKYFLGKPLIDRVEYIIDREKRTLENFIKGELDQYTPTRKDKEKIQKEYPELQKRIFTTPELSVHRLDFNNTKPPFSNILVRKAIAHIIDSKRFVEEVLAGEGIPAKGIFPPSSYVYNPELKGYTRDFDKARKLLSEAEYEQGFEFTLTITGTENYRRNADFIEKCLAPFNIKVKREEMEWKDFLEAIHTGKTQSHLIGWIADTGDPDSFVYPLFHSSSLGGGGNECFYTNSEIDLLIEKARTIREPFARKKLYHEIETKILDDCPCVFLYHSINKSLLRENVYGVYTHPIGHHKLWIAVKT